MSTRKSMVRIIQNGKISSPTRAVERIKQGSLLDSKKTTAICQKKPAFRVIKNSCTLK